MSKQKTLYTVGRMVVIRPDTGLVDNNPSPPELKWVPDPHFGTFGSSLDAKRAYAVAMEPSKRDWPDSNIRSWFDSNSKGLCARILKVKEEGK